MYSYSQRLSWDFFPNSFSKLVQEKRAAGIELLDLTISNPTEALEAYPHAAIGRAYADVRDFTYRPNPLGEEEARCAIADYYARRGMVVSTGRILLTASTSEAYSLVFKLFCDPGDEILVPIPSYPLFEYLAALESVRLIPYRLFYDGCWSIDFADLQKRISPRTRAVVLVNPNNPTGSFLKKREAETLFELAREHRLPVVSDEVFMDYQFGDGGDRIESLVRCDSGLTFSFNGFSKSMGMPQMKLAWLLINGAESERQVAQSRLEVLLDTYLSVATPVQRALPALFEVGESIQQHIRAQVTRNLKRLDELLKETPARHLHTEGGWTATIQLPNTLSEDEWINRLLQEKSVVVQPGYFFDMEREAYVVVSLLTPTHIFDEGIGRMRQLASGI